MSKLVDWLIERAKRTPYFHLPGYMERYWLVPFTHSKEAGCGWVSWWRRPFAFALQCLRVSAKIHVILRSDLDRAYHDHPWAYCTVILRGGYWELTPQFDKSGLYIGRRDRYYGPGSVLFRRANHFHKLLMHEPTTTLFISWKKTQSWGFMPHPETNKVYYKDYHANGEQQ